MMYSTLITGLREKDFMTFRWNADVHTIHRKTGEYRILNNRGIYMGEIVKEGEENYKIVFYGRIDKEIVDGINKIKDIVEKINQLKNPEIKTGIFSRQIDHYQRNSLRHAA
jgi:hypothetical protein